MSFATRTDGFHGAVDAERVATPTVITPLPTLRIDDILTSSRGVFQGLNGCSHRADSSLDSGLELVASDTIEIPKTRITT